MPTDRIRLLRRVNRPANAVVVRVVGSGDPDERDEFRHQLAELHTLVVSALVAEHPAPKRVILDLRRLRRLTPRTSGELIKFDRFLRAARTELVLVATEPAVLDALRGLKPDRPSVVFGDAAGLNKAYGAELVPNEDAVSEDESVSFTEAELREMEATGLTLGDAIRSLEADDARE
jgi:hypothetical protein